MSNQRVVEVIAMAVALQPGLQTEKRVGALTDAAIDVLAALRAEGFKLCRPDEHQEAG